MNFQYIAVFLIIAAALVYAGVMLRKRTRSFSSTSGCEADCGCGETPKTTSINRG